MSSLRLLIIRLSSMGDVILQTSLVELLKQKYGNRIQISFLTSKEFEPLLKGHPQIDQLLIYDRKNSNTKALFEQLNSAQRDGAYDLILDLHNTLRSTLIRWRFFYIPSLAVDKRKIERFFLTKFKLNFFNLWGENTFQLERILLDFSGILGLSYQRHHLSQYIQRQVELKNADEQTLSTTALSYLLKTQNYNPRKLWEKNQYICLFPAAAHENKRWPVAHFISLCQLFLSSTVGQNKKILILAGQNDHFCSEFNTLVASYPNRVFNLQGQCSLTESALLTRDAWFCVGNDTGLVHIAESFSTPCLVLFGPTSEAFGFTPHLKHSKSLSLEMWCRPCSTTGKSGCFRRERFCMTHLTPQSVMEEVKDLCLEIA